MTHYKGSVGTSLTLDRKIQYHSDVFASEKEYYRYAKLAGRIENEVGIRYQGHTDASLKRFVNAYRHNLKSENTKISKKSPKKQ